MKDFDFVAPIWKKLDLTTCQMALNLKYFCQEWFLRLYIAIIFKNAFVSDRKLTHSLTHSHTQIPGECLS